MGRLLLILLALVLMSVGIYYFLWPLLVWIFRLVLGVVILGVAGWLLYRAFRRPDPGGY